jgi:hypothetical protein
LPVVLIHEREVSAIVEHPPTAANHLPAVPADVVDEASPRREVVLVHRIVVGIVEERLQRPGNRKELQVVADAEVQSEAVVQPPLVLDEHAERLRLHPGSVRRRHADGQTLGIGREVGGIVGTIGAEAEDSVGTRLLLEAVLDVAELHAGLHVVIAALARNEPG